MAEDITTRGRGVGYIHRSRSCCSGMGGRWGGCSRPHEDEESTGGSARVRALDGASVPCPSRHLFRRSCAQADAKNDEVGKNMRGEETPGWTLGCSTASCVTTECDPDMGDRGVGRFLGPTRRISAMRASGAGERRGNKDEGKTDRFVSLHDVKISISASQTVFHMRKEQYVLV
jgi:hypothetical protein